jgi:hypothetical protein
LKSLKIRKAEKQKIRQAKKVIVENKAGQVIYLYRKL